MAFKLALLACLVAASLASQERHGGPGGGYGPGPCGGPDDDTILADHGTYTIKHEDHPLEVKLNNGDCQAVEMGHDTVAVEYWAAGDNYDKYANCAVKIAASEYKTAMDLYVWNLHLPEEAELVLETVNGMTITLNSNHVNHYQPIEMPITYVRVVFASNVRLDNHNYGFLLKFVKITNCECHQLLRLMNDIEAEWFQLPHFNPNQVRRCIWCLKAPENERVRMYFDDYFVGHTAADGYMLVDRSGDEFFAAETTIQYDYERDIPEKLTSVDRKICLLTFFTRSDAKLKMQFGLK